MITITKTPKENLISLSIFRIGTSGALHPDIVPGTAIFSRYCIGMDNLLSYYNLQNTETEKSFISALSKHLPASLPFYFVGADDELARHPAGGGGPYGEVQGGVHMRINEK